MTATTAGLNFLFTLILISKFGIGEKLDFYFLYLIIPQTLLGIFAAPISSFVLPALCNVVDGKEKLMKQWAYIGINFSLSLLLMLTVALFGFFYDSYIGIEESYLFLMFTLSIPSYFLHQSLLTVYHSNEKFADFEFINLLSLLLPLILLFLIPNLEIQDAPLFLVLRNILCVAVFSFMTKLIKPSVKEIKSVFSVVKSSGRLIISFSLTKLQPLIERSVLVSFGSGMLSLFYVSQQVYTLIIQIVNKGYTATIVPKLSRSIYSNDQKTIPLLVNTSFKSFLGAFFLSASAVIFFMLIVELGLDFREITKENFQMLLNFSMLLFVPASFNLLKDFLYTGFYALHNSVMPFRIELAGLLIFGAAKLLLFFGGSIWIFLLILNVESITKYIWAIWAGFYVFSKDSLGSVGSKK